MSSRPEHKTASKPGTPSIVVSDEDKKRVFDYLAASEVSNRHDKIHSLEHAETEKSGYSLGRTQIDLAGAEDIRKALLAFLGTQGFRENELATLENDLKIKGNPAAISDDLKKRIDTAIGSTAGRAKVKEWDRKQADETAVKAAEVVAAARTNPRYATDPDFRAFTDSPTFFYQVADNINQFGEPGGLKRFVTGNHVSRVDGTVSRLGERALTMDTLAEYENGYQWVRRGDEAGKAPDKGAQDIRRRRLGVLKNLVADGLISAETSESLKRTINTVYQSNNERKNGSSAGQANPVRQPTTAKAAGGDLLIQPGDTLSKIAARHGVSVAALAEANNIADIGRIRAGQSLVLPRQQSQATPPKEETASKPDDTPLPEAPLSPPSPVSFLGPRRPPKSTLLTAEHPDQVFDPRLSNEVERRLSKLYPTMAPR